MKRFTSFILVLCMMLAMIPMGAAAAFAEDSSFEALPAPQGLEWGEWGKGFSDWYFNFTYSSTDEAGYVICIYANDALVYKRIRGISTSYSIGTVIKNDVPYKLFDQSMYPLEVKIAVLSETQFNECNFNFSYIEEHFDQLNFASISTNYDRPDSEMEQVTNVHWDAAATGPVICFDGVSSAKSYILQEYRLVNGCWEETGSRGLDADITTFDLSEDYSSGDDDFAVCIRTISQDNRQIANSLPTEALVWKGNDFDYTDPLAVEILSTPTGIRWIDYEDFTFDSVPGAYAYDIELVIDNNDENVTSMLLTREQYNEAPTVLLPVAEEYYDSSFDISVRVTALTYDQCVRGKYVENLNVGYSEILSYIRPDDEMDKVINVHWSDSKALVSWDDVDGAAGYLVTIYDYVSEEDGSYVWEECGSATVDESSLDVTRLIDSDAEDAAVIIRTISANKDDIANSLPTKGYSRYGTDFVTGYDNPVEAVLTFENNASFKAIKKGETFTLLMNLVNNPGLIAIQNSVVYDNSVLELVSVSEGAVLDNMQTNSNTAAMPYTMIWYDAYSPADVSDTGCMAELTFKIKDDAANGDYTISIISMQAFDTNHNEIATLSSDATLRVMDYTIGDANNDGRVSMADASFILKCIVNEEGYTLVNFGAADLDLNDAIDVNDVVILLRHIANWSGYEELPWLER